MARRFEYDTMTTAQFNAELERLQWTPNTFARVFGLNHRTVERYAIGMRDVPAWIYVAFALMTRLDGGVVTARDAAAEMIKFDNHLPELGEYPFLERDE